MTRKTVTARRCQRFAAAVGMGWRDNTIHSTSSSSTGSSAPLALDNTASRVHSHADNAMPATARLTRPRASASRDAIQPSRPINTNVAGNIASRCTMYNVVETSSGCSSHAPAPNNAAMAGQHEPVSPPGRFGCEGAASEPLSPRERGRGEGTGSRLAAWLPGTEGNGKSEPSPGATRHPLPKGEGSSILPSFHNTHASSTPLSRCRMTLVALNGCGLAGQSRASIRNVSSVSGRPVGRRRPR